MSGLFNAVAQGLSSAGYGAGELYGKEALAENNSDLELQRAQRLTEFKARLEMDLSNQQREAQTSRINAKTSELADSEIADKRSNLMGRMGDASTWTPEQQAAVDQSLGIDRRSLLNDTTLRTKAAVQTGDIGPKDAAVLDQKDEALLYKTLWEQQKEEGRNARADARIAAQAEASDKRLAYLFASLDKRGEKKTQTETAKEALQFLEGSRKQVASEESNLRQLYQAQIKDKSKSEIAKIDAEYKPKFEDITRKRGEIEQDYNSVRERVGLPARTAAAPAPNPNPNPNPIPAPSTKPLSALPAGAKKIGTSGGKAVYQLPDGSRFIEQ